MKSIRKIVTEILVLACVVSAIPNKVARASIMTPTVEHSWSYTTGTPYSTNEGRECIYYGAPATRKGETDTISHTISYSHCFSGSLEFSIKKKVEVQVGYTFGIEKNFSVSKTCAPLERGEYVKGYIAKSYEVTPINQKDEQHIYGWRQKETGGEYEYVDYYNTERSVAYAKKAIAPQLTFEYYKSKSTNKNLEELLIEGRKDVVDYFIQSDAKEDWTLVEEGELVRTEYYDFIDGEYQLVSIEYPNANIEETTDELTANGIED